MARPAGPAPLVARPFGAFARGGAALVHGARALAQQARERTAPAQRALRPVTAVLGCVSPFGRGVAVAAVVCWWASRALGWAELVTAAALLAALLVLSVAFTVGRTALEVSVRLEPERVVAGTSSAAQVFVRNVGRGPLLPLSLDLPAAGTTTTFALPPLAPGGDFEDMVVLPTRRRGVHVVGPATTVRGDPFGLVRRSVTWTTPTELFVHPRTVPLEPFGSGLLKDLEGRTTDEVSMSDLAFHALREYAPGDDRRHIHWLSSAKRSGRSGTDLFMVRQFLDTRRSHLGLVVDCRETVWLDTDELETAIEVAASIAVRSLIDGADVSEAGGRHLVTRPRRHVALDLFSRLAPSTDPLPSVAARLARTAPAVSTVVLVTGALATFEELRRSAAAFSPDVRQVAVRVEHGASPTLQRSGGLSVLTVGALADLPRALAGRALG